MIRDETSRHQAIPSSVGSFLLPSCAWWLFITQLGLIFLKNILFYLFMTDTHRERGRDTDRERSRLHAGSPTWDWIRVSRITPWAEGGAKPLATRSLGQFFCSMSVAYWVNPICVLKEVLVALSRTSLYLLSSLLHPHHCKEMGDPLPFFILFHPKNGIGVEIKEG